MERLKEIKEMERLKEIKEMEEKEQKQKKKILDKILGDEISKLAEDIDDGKENKNIFKDTFIISMPSQQTFKSTDEVINISTNSTV